MYGYIRTNEPELKVKELAVYRSAYCGLCDSLVKRHGRIAQMTLEHDMTFLVLLLEGLYEPKVTHMQGRCIVHPIQKHRFDKSEITDYAADMNVLMAWHKINDDVHDEGKFTSKAMRRMLYKRFKVVNDKYPEKSRHIMKALSILNTLENKKNLFPTVTLTERPDKASMSLLEGKIIIITDMSPYAIILPSFLVDFFHTVDDYYQKDFNTTFIRIIRAFAFLIAIFLPALYISITTRNYNLVPMKLLMVLKSGRTFVPFAAYIEALFMIVAFEILKESDTRIPFVVGTSMSIVGALVLGQAAVDAGLISPIMIIIIAVSSVTSFLFNDNDLVNAIRVWKLIFILLSAFAGLYGFFIALLLFIVKISSMDSYGFDYVTVDGILKSNIQKNGIILTKKFKLNKRNSVLTKNTERR